MNITVNNPNIDYQDARDIERAFNSLRSGRQQTVASSYSNFCDWLRDDHYSLYSRISSQLRDIWDELCDVFSEILEGVAIGAAAVVALPVIGAVEGIKAIGRWLDDL